MGAGSMRRPAPCVKKYMNEYWKKFIKFLKTNIGAWIKAAITSWIEAKAKEKRRKDLLNQIKDLNDELAKAQENRRAALYRSDTIGLDWYGDECKRLSTEIATLDAKLKTGDF
jgi:hypothetical protein